MWSGAQGWTPKGSDDIGAVMGLLLLLKNVTK
jgi:hypothetical protein